MSIRMLVAVTAIWITNSTLALAERPIDDLPDQAASDGWEEVDFGDDAIGDPQFQLAQATSSRSSNDGSGNYRTARSSRTSRVPYMVGDSEYIVGSMGANGALRFEGIDVAEIQLPALGGNRHNIAEGNSPLPGDRVFFNYRHFHNATQTNVLGVSNDLDIERFDVGIEKAMCDGIFSAELRAPIYRQLNSDINIFDGPGGSAGIPLSDRSGEFGNLAATFKVLLTSRSNYAVAGGLAVNMPTADGARISQNYVNSNITLSDSGVGTIAPTTLAFNGRFDNDTVNLIPFLAWQVRPTDRFFHQGFLQIDAPLNGSNAEVALSGTVTPNTADLDPASFNIVDSGEVEQQTLLRLNLGFGYWLCQGGPGDALRGVAGLFEVHYTTTLDDANPYILPVSTLPSNTIGVDSVPIDVVAGSIVDNLEQVNVSTGLAMDFGGMVITNGFVVPVSDDETRSFDFEYNLQVHRRF